MQFSSFVPDTTTNQVVLYSMAPNTTIVFTAQSPPVSGQIAETQNAGFELDVKPNSKYCIRIIVFL